MNYEEYNIKETAEEQIKYADKLYEQRKNNPQDTLLQFNYFRSVDDLESMIHKRFKR